VFSDAVPTTGRVLFQAERRNGMAKRGRPRKYCRCRNKKTCEHHWIMRLKIKGQPRRYVDLTETFPNDAPDVAAAKARHDLRSAQPADARLTLEQVIERFGAKRCYLEVLRRRDYVRHAIRSRWISWTPLSKPAVAAASCGRCNGPTCWPT
jgi:hypothetical protein